MPAVEVEGLVKRYGDLVAVDDVTFGVEPGEVFALLGPNGAGKTTTVEVLEGLRRRDGGHVRVLDCDPASDAKKLTPFVGAMPQTGELYNGLKTEEAVRLFAAFYDDAEDPREIMTRLQLDRVARTAYRRLSGGERRRLSLALAIVGRPRVAFLDEPTAGMDVEGRATTWSIVRELCDRGVAVVLTTHLLDEAERVADTVGIVNRGKLVALGPPAKLAGRSRALTFTTERPVDTAALSAALGLPVGARGDAYVVEGAEPDSLLIARLTAWLADAGIALRHLDAGHRSLEDVYLELTR